MCTGGHTDELHRRPVWAVASATRCLLLLALSLRPHNNNNHNNHNNNNNNAVQMPALGYTVDVIVLCTLVAIAWPLYVGQLLALRFTPRKKRVMLKVCMILTGLFTLVATTVRAPDANSVFGRISDCLSAEMASQATAGVMYSGCFWLLASAKSLYVQIQQAMSRALAPALFGSVIVFQLTHTTVILVQTELLQRNYSDAALLRLTVVLGFVLVVQTLFMLAVTWLLFLNLRRKIAAFIAKLAAQEATRVAHRRQQQLPAVPLVVAGPLAGYETSSVSSHPQGQYSLQHPLVLQARVNSSDQDDDGSSAAGTLGAMTPRTLPTAASPRVTNANAISPRTADATTPRVAAVNAWTANGALAPLKPPPPASSRRNTSGAASGGGSAASVHPAPPPLSAGGGVGVVAIVVAAALPKTNAAAAAAVYATASASSVSSAQDRLSELAAALRKITRMTMLITLICAGTVGDSYLGLKAGLQGQKSQDYGMPVDPGQRSHTRTRSHARTWHAPESLPSRLFLTRTIVFVCCFCLLLMDRQLCFRPSDLECSALVVGVRDLLVCLRLYANPMLH